MKELKVGEKFDNAVFPNWYKQITKIIDIQSEKALIQYVNDWGAVGYAHMQFDGKEWSPFITAPSNCKGLLYGSHYEEDY